MQPSDDERLFGALAHASVAANVLNLMGMVGVIAIWATQRRRSAFVREHALQALLYQGAVLLLGLAMTLVWAGCLVLSLLPAMLRPELYRDSLPPLFWFVMFAATIPVMFGIAAIMYGLFGAFQVYRGKPFAYPVIGRLVRKRIATPVTPPVLPVAPSVPPAAPDA